MATHLQGSFFAYDAFTVRTTVGASTADWVVAEGTTYASSDAVLAAWNTALTPIGVTVQYTIDAASHTATVSVDTGGSTFEVTWSHAGDGTSMRDFLGEVGDLSGESDGYAFDNPLAVAWFPSYDLRRLNIAAEPWDMQRMMTGSGAVTTNSPHTNVSGLLRYSATVEFWFGHSAGSSYLYYEALRDFFDGLFRFGQPFQLVADGATHTCRLSDTKQLQLVPEPVDDVERGDIYSVSFGVTVVA